MTPKKLRWWTYFKDICERTAQMSKDPNTQVGAVVVDEYFRIKGLGFNGLARGVVDTLEKYTRPQKYSWVIHAEHNAILNGHDVRNCMIFTQWVPCPQCMACIIQSGITSVYTWLEYKHYWPQDDYKQTLQQSQESKVPIYKIHFEEKPCRETLVSI